MKVLSKNSARRIKKRKKTELIKSVIILMLFSVFLFLGYRVIITGKLIDPTTIRREIHSIENLSGDEDAVNLYFEYTSPEYILINRGGARDIFRCDSEVYSRAKKILNEVNKSILAQNAKILEVSDKAALEELISEASLTASYSYRRYPKYSLRFFNGRDDKLSPYIQTYKKIVLLPSEGDRDSVFAYITDEKTEKTYKISTTVPSSSLKHIIGTVKENGAKKYTYASELNFKNAPQNSGDIKSVGINKDILIPLSSITKPEAEYSAPSAFSKGADGELIAEIAGIFGMNAGSLRQYIDKEKTVVCVSENATLKVFSSGVIEYSASKLNGGLNLAGGLKLNTENSYFYSFSGTARIINALSKLAKNDSQTVKLRLTELQAESTEVSEYKFMYDWYLGGIKVLSKPYHGVEATVSEGRLTYMRADLKQFLQTHKQVEVKPLLSAIDEYYSNRPEDSRRSLSACDLVYPINPSSEVLTPQWDIY